ncbi:transcriptional regulator, LysR family [Rhizobium sp. RU35A]|uniref:LysR family transcriptional regulator n=1 Tax=Rhizobium straminoryzae TaxID=1387186 RepID=A0A549T6P5_9HYPH|nr:MULTISPECIES: LysR substrate-binding domain-containing protein [Rhizobium]TRL37510.1 LysR family transcriptional regulator [Rhizobium straminoryzae]SIQ54012.1 transcriptional regulator, LysR family [Rhizobium sp. RU35A]
MDKLPPLTSLSALEAFFRTGSVGGAAEMLGRTHSAVSKQLHQLQDHSGTELFVKRGLQLELTSDGRLLAETVARSMDEMRRTYTAVTGGGRASVTVAASSTFARQWMIPTIARFNVEYPDIDVLIRVVGPQGSRRTEGPVDLVISWDRLKHLDVEHPLAVSLGDVHIGVVLAPTYPFEMTATTLRIQTILQRREAENSWEHWSRLADITVIRQRELTFDLSSLAFEAAERGMGATIAPKFLIEKELKSGSLIAPAGFLTFRDGLLVYPATERPKLSKPARLLRDWLVAHAQLDADGFIADPVTPQWPFTSAGVDW